MPDLVAAGPLAVALENLRTLIANSAWFQTWTGSANAAAALLRVVIGSVGYNIKSVALASNVATIVTHEPHNLSAGSKVTIEGIDDTFDGSFTVASVTDTRTFTYAKTASDVAENTVESGVVMQSQRPFVVLQEGDEGLQMRTVGSGPTSVFSGSIDIFISVAISSQYENDPRNAKIEMSNAFGEFLSALSDMSGTSSPDGSVEYMTLNTIDPVVMPSFIHHAEQRDNQVRFETWEATVRVAWGLDA